jgi:hypothetical protein
MTEKKASFVRRAALRARMVFLVTMCLLAPEPSTAQQPPTSAPQAPVRTGKSYSTSDPIRKPPPSAPLAPSPVTFTDVTAALGITFKHAASPTSQKYLLESMGSGAAVIDYDNDGRLDLFFTNGAHLQDPMPKGAAPVKSDPKFWNRLFRQKSDGTFEDVTDRAGVRGEGYSMGVAAADYDNDGFTDLYVTAYGANTLYRNRGDGTFTDVTKKLGCGGGGWSTSAGWFDYDRDGRLDLFVARYAEWDFELGSIYCGEQRPGYRAYCHPDNFNPVPNLLYRQKPDGTFEDVSVAAHIAVASGKGLGVAFADFDLDGWTDVFVANDSVRQSLFRNKGDGTFEETALLSGAGYDENGKTFAGMGVDAADYDNDGFPDVFITALSNETYPLFHNNRDGSFNYTTNATGIGRITLLYSGWGTRFIDADNDGWRDIFVAQGHVLDTIEKTSSYLTYRQPPLLMRNTGKGFVSVAAGAAFDRPLAARGAAFGDLDNDGDTDVVIGQVDGAPVILRNGGTKNHWLGLSLTGDGGSNRNGIGAHVTVIDTENRRQVCEVSGAGSYLSSSDLRVIVGLGQATGVRSVEVRWPGGRVQKLAPSAIDVYLTINERDASPAPQPAR